MGGRGAGEPKHLQPLPLRGTWRLKSFAHISLSAFVSRHVSPRTIVSLSSVNPKRDKRGPREKGEDLGALLTELACLKINFVFRKSVL